MNIWECRRFILAATGVAPLSDRLPNNFRFCLSWYGKYFLVFTLTKRIFRCCFTTEVVEVVEENASDWQSPALKKKKISFFFPGAEFTAPRINVSNSQLFILTLHPAIIKWSFSRPLDEKKRSKIHIYPLICEMKKCLTISSGLLMWIDRQDLQKLRI